MTKMYGLNTTVTTVNQDNLASLAKEYGVPLSDWFGLDSSFFYFFDSFDREIYREFIRDHSQPLRVLYFDKSGYAVSFHTNCYAGGFPNLKWNRYGVFNTFVPQTQAPIDSLLTRDTLLSFLQPTLYSKEINFSEYDYLAVVFWGSFMGRQSRRLIRTVQQNAKLAPENLQVRIIYVNLDNFFIYETTRTKNSEAVLQVDEN